MPTDGNPIVNFRLPAKLKDRTEPMRQAVSMPAMFEALASLWDHSPDPETFLKTLQGLEGDAETNEKLLERSRQIGTRNTQLTRREKEISAREEDVALKTQAAEARVRKAHAQLQAILAESQLSMELIREMRAAFKAGYRPADLVAVGRLARSLEVDPSKAVPTLRHFGGTIQAIREMEEQQNTLAAKIKGREAQVAWLESEIHSLQTQKASLVAEVSAALSTARGEFSTGADAVLVRLEENASTILTRLEESTGAAIVRIEDTARSLSDFATNLPALLGRELLEPFERLLQMGLVVEALDGSPTLDRLAVAAKLLKIEVERNGDAELPRTTGEYIAHPTLSWVVQKVWALAADHRPVLPDGDTVEGDVSS